MNGTIRRMEAGDLGRVAELAGQLGYRVSEPEIEARFRRIADDPSHGVYVAQGPDGRVIGWIHLQPKLVLESEPSVEIEGLVVDATARRTGVGRALIAHAEGWARERGFRVLRLRSNVLRTEAHAFYPALGFTVAKTQHLYVRRLS
jgi:GNAT superfamily N-acetyltransferase